MAGVALRRLRSGLGLLLVGVCLAWAGVGRAEDPMREPWEAAPRPVVGRETRTEVLLGVQAVRLFQKFVSPVDGPRCRLYPTCSEFARLAVRRYGLLVGSALAAGRLLRDNGSEAGYYRILRRGNRLVYYDPPEDHWPPWGRKRA